MAHYTVDGQFQFDIPIEDNKTPQLEDWQKREIQDLMSEYFANKSNSTSKLRTTTEFVIVLLSVLMF